MIRRTLKSGQHYGVSHSTTDEHFLLQAEEADGMQVVRLQLTPDEARALGTWLSRYAARALEATVNPAGDEGE